MRVAAITIRCLTAAALAFGLAQGMAVAAPNDTAQVFDAAVQEYRLGHWSAAYGRFSKLADSGHPDSARMAMHMLGFGPAVYKTEWTTSPAQLIQWRQTANISPLELSIGSAD